MNIKLLETDTEILESFHVMKVLRPHLVQEDYLEKVRRQQDNDGYSLLAAIDDNGEIGALAGFRIAEFMDWGKILYIDDLITDPDKKRKGFAGALLDWLDAEAREAGCDEIHLDTGHQRHDAHRLYLNKGFTLSSHHMSKKLTR